METTRMRWLAIVVPLLLLIALGACEGPVGGRRVRKGPLVKSVPRVLKEACA